MKSVILSSFTATLLVIGLMACGGGGSSSSSTKSKTDEISKRKYVVIFYNYPEDVCESSSLKNGLKQTGGTDIITLAENRVVSCKTYGKTNDGEECMTMDYSSYSDNKSTCVIGLNRTSSDNSMSKSTNDRLFMEDVQEAVIRAF